MTSVINQREATIIAQKERILQLHRKLDAQWWDSWAFAWRLIGEASGRVTF